MGKYLFHSYLLFGPRDNSKSPLNEDQPRDILANAGRRSVLGPVLLNDVLSPAKGQAHQRKKGHQAVRKKTTFWKREQNSNYVSKLKRQRRNTEGGGEYLRWGKEGLLDSLVN